MSEQDLLDRAAALVATADALVVGAGAGMGVDSGLPDFRGDQGFWRAYPPFAKLGLNFRALANPHWFRADPELAWGFYGHRLNLYRRTTPHAGFALLRQWTDRLPHGGFVYTSNVDGHFQRAGFPEDRVMEVHGTLQWMQCLNRCGTALWPVDPAAPAVTVDESTMRAVLPLPACPACGGLARPNVLMFGDDGWDGTRSWDQERRFNRWLEEVAGKRLTVVECGAGTAVPSVRHLCEYLVRTRGARLVRINLREPEVPTGQIGMAMAALQALRAVDQRLDLCPIRPAD